MAKKAKAVPVPANLAEASKFLARFGELDREIRQIENRLADRVVKLRHAADELLGPLQAALTKTKLGLHQFADKHRSRLLPKGEKTVQLPTGSFGWRDTPYRVVTGMTKHADIIATLKAADLAAKYVRTKEMLNKQALLDHRPVVKGVKYTRGEIFFAVAKSAIVESSVTAPSE